MSTWIRIALELVGSLVIGVLSSFFIQEPYVDLVIGFFAFLMFEVLRIGVVVDSIADSTQRLSQMAASLQHPVQSHLDLVFNALLFSHLLERNFVIGAQHLCAPASEAHELWLRILSNVESRLWSTNYAKNEESWMRSVGDRAASIQKWKIKDGSVVRRIFIVDDKEEYQRTRNLMESHERDGVEVRWILKDDIEVLAVASENLRELGVYDFAILDNHHVVKVFLDRKRRWKEFELTRDSEQFALAKRVYEDLWLEAKPCAIGQGA